ncbi:hypothetical protein Kisp01_61480 [Kineosporia sp. NBRC 101677]|nr:hypothetical protein Kisp01_61480 [Kineosporia sp. NBRC 101677]
MSETTNNQFLSTCIACGHTVAKAAPACPKCGQPQTAASNALSGNRERGPTMIHPYVSFAVIGLFLLIIVIAVLSQ